jgi:hypothetical protein
VRYYITPADSVRYPFRVITGSSTALCVPSAVALGPNGELFVLNQAPQDRRQDSAAGRWERWVTVYDSAAGGDATPIRVLHVQSSWLGNPSTMHVDREGNLYLGSKVEGVIDDGSVAVFEAGADGDAKPLRVIAGPGTGLFRPAAVAVDRRGFVYALNSQDGPFGIRGMARTFANVTRSTAPWAQAALDPYAVRIFAPGAAGDVAPSRLISGERTELQDPVGLALDRRDRLYVANSASVTMYLPSATGDVAPARRFTDRRTHYRMGPPAVVLLDSHDSLFVRSGGVLDSRRDVTVFAPTDSTVPSRSFYRNAPALFAFDRHDTLFALVGDTVKVLPPGYAGVRPPVRAISGPHTGIRSVTAMVLDRDGQLYLTMRDSAIVRVYGAGASGDARPVRTIAGPHTLLTKPRGVAVDKDGRLYVTNGQRSSGGGGAIRVYAAGARGEDQPVRTLAGPDVKLPVPLDIARGSRGDLYVAASKENSGGQVLVLQQRRERFDSVVHTLTGPSTLLRGPIALATGRGDTLYALNVFGAFATVTVYAPDAGGDAEPVRVINVRPEGRTPVQAPLGAPRDLAADTTGAVQVWATDGGLIYQPGASGAGNASWVTLLKAVEGDRGAVAVAGDGTVYQAIGPSRYEGRYPGLITPADLRE